MSGFLGKKNNSSLNSINFRYQKFGKRQKIMKM
jgi:hypothetical protein